MKMKNTLVALLSALLLLTGCGNGNQANQTPKLEKKLPIGLQMYGMRDDLAQDFYGTLVKVKEMGYEGVEFSGLHNIDPAQIRQWCDELGLVVVSNHVSVTEIVVVSLVGVSVFACGNPRKQHAPFMPGHSSSA